MHSITITFAGFSVAFEVFTSKAIPRRRIEGPAIGYTAKNIVNRKGLAIPAPHLWTIGTKLSRFNAFALQGLYDAYIENPGPVTVDDLILPLSESSQSLPLATGAPPAETINGRTRYFAQFQAEFQGQFTLEQRGPWFVAAFQLVEVY